MVSTASSYYSASNFLDDQNLGQDKSISIIIDFGLKLTKVGYSGESEPRHIIPTPEFLDFEKYIKDDTKKHIEARDYDQNSLEERLLFQNDNVSLLTFKRPQKDIKYEMEHFINSILYNNLQLQKKKREKFFICLLCIDPFLDNQEIYKILVKTILDYSIIHSVRILPKNILPIYSTGIHSGIVIDMGYLNTTIIPIFNGYPMINEMKILEIGGIQLEKSLKRHIFDDNNYFKDNKPRMKNIDQLNNGVIKYLGDLVVRSAVCLNKKLSILLKNPSELAKIKGEKDNCRVDIYTDLPDFQINFLSRIELGEKIFGDFDSDEINVAYSLLKIIQSIPCEVRKTCVQNIVLAGGTSMILGCYKRFLEEINYIFETCTEFNEIKAIKDTIKLHKVLFPRNTLTWIGASVLSSFEKFNMKNFSITKEEFDTDSKILSKKLEYFQKS